MPAEPNHYRYQMALEHSQEDQHSATQAHTPPTSREESIQWETAHSEQATSLNSKLGIERRKNLYQGGKEKERKKQKATFIPIKIRNYNLSPWYTLITSLKKSLMSAHFN
jgi:glutamate mutase epsilon subunit